METKDLRWVYDRLVCEFDHYDLCLVGLISDAGTYQLVRLIDDGVPDSDLRYTVHPINWTPECDEYLADYRASYPHWFHADGKRPAYDGRSLKWFADKWQRNPIVDAAL